MTRSRSAVGRFATTLGRAPGRLVGRLRRRRAEAALAVGSALPRPIRSAVLQPVVQLAERLAHRPRSKLAPQVAFIAYLADGSPAEAARLALRVGASPTASRYARRRLAQLAIGSDMRDVAQAIVDSMPADTSATMETLRARLALDAGRYTDALDHARNAAARGAHADSLIARAQGHLTVLQPGWLPDLGADAGRLSRLRGTAVRGRVLHLVSVSLPYRLAGYTVRTQAIAKAQQGVGLDPHVVTRAGFPGNAGFSGVPHHEVYDGVPHHHVSPDFRTNGPLDERIAASARGIVSLVEELRPAVLQPASNHLQAQAALAIAEPLGIPVVYEVRGFWEESRAARSDEDAARALDRYRLTREVETSLMQAAAAIVTLSETMRGEIIERGCDPARVIVVPNAVEVERFEPRSRDIKLAASLGIGPADPVIGYVSTLNGYEGIPYLLQATARLRSAVRGLRVLIVGDGDDRERIAEEGRRLGLDDGTLIMTGRVPHERITRYYSILDVFVVPRTTNRVSRLVTPLKPFEAMAMAKATVVSDLPALREIVTPRETGMTFRPEDPVDLARVLGELLTDEALRSRLGRQAREWIVTERTWAQNGRRYRELFEELGVA